MTPIRWPRLQSPALGTNSGTACDQRAILYILYIRLRGMFKTGNISSDPDTSTHTPDFNSRTPPEVDQSLILQEQQEAQYKALEGQTWKCSECPRKINRDNMNPYLPSMCQRCQNGMMGL